MNAVTKSGSNSFHGTVYEFMRDSKMDAKNYFDRPTDPIPPFRRDQFGATVGGPLKKDRMFFFANYEGLTQSLGLTRVLTVPDANARAGLLPIGPGGALVNVGVDPRVAAYMKFWPAPDRLVGGGQGVVTLNPTQTAHENYVTGRVDLSMSKNDSLFVRYVSDLATQNDPAAGPIPELWPAINSNNNQFATVEEKHIFSDGALNLLRVDVSRPWQRSQTDVVTHSEFQFFPNEGLPDGSIAVGSGITGFGSAAPGPWQFSQGRAGVADDIYWTKGAHNLKFGGSITRVASDVFSPIPGQGGYTFNSFQLFLQGVPLQYSGTLPGQRDASRQFREMYYVAYSSGRLAGVADAHRQSRPALRADQQRHGSRQQAASHHRPAGQPGIRAGLEHLRSQPLAQELGSADRRGMGAPQRIMVRRFAPGSASFTASSARATSRRPTTTRRRL